MTLTEIHAVLQQAFEAVIGLRDDLPEMQEDTAFALGEAAGVLSKAKALVNRDITGTSVADPLLLGAADRIEKLEKVLFMLLDDIELGEGPSELALEWASEIRRNASCR